MSALAKRLRTSAVVVGLVGSLVGGAWSVTAHGLDASTSASVGVPGEDVNEVFDAGAVQWFPPTEAGEPLSGIGSWPITLASIRRPLQAGARFGATVAQGDLDGDGFAELVIGAPGAYDGAGAVYVLPGGPDGGLDYFEAGGLLQGRGLISGGREPGDAFGAAIAIGTRSNGEGWLAISAPGEDLGGIEDAGLVHVVDGTLTGGDVLISQRSLGLASEPHDRFGTTLASAGTALVVGTPLEDVAGSIDAGIVSVLAAASGDLPGSGATRNLLPGSAGTPGISEAGDHFGAALAWLDPTLVIGAPGEDVGSAADAGAIVVVSLGAPAPAQHWWQGVGGLEGSAETGDGFGASLSAGADAFVVVGVPGEDVGAAADSGAVQVIRASASGLVAAGNQFVTQASTGVEGDSETGDRFGHAVSTHGERVLVGAPFEDLGPRADAGAIWVFIAAPSGGLDLAGDQLFTQDSSDVRGIAETGDQFGAATSGDR
ncbi:MAG TPA: FG-GAP repeat protein [Acidimicrobiia bacterium]|nr:FG-GAP repeat protein [Acidimicrobiia bacterium]